MLGKVAAVNHFAGGDAGNPSGQFVRGALGQAQFALGHAQPRQAAALRLACSLAGVNRQHIGLSFVIKQFGVGQGARCDHPHHLAIHRPFATHFAHLLANRYRFTQLDQLSQVVVHRVKRHTCHHHGLARRLAALRERDVHQTGGFFGIFKKQLVKIPHAVEKQGVGEVRFEAQVLGDHGGVLRQIGHGHSTLTRLLAVSQIFAQLPDQLGGDTLVFGAGELGVLVQQGHQLGVNFGVGGHAFALV